MNSLDPKIATEREFHAAVQAFLGAVKNRDFQAFERYFRTDLEFKAVLPGGKIFDDVPSFMASQMNWFNGKSGSFDFKVERTEVASDLGAAFAKVSYKDNDVKGNPFALEIYISFLFRRVDGQWFLIHDQNSVLRESK